MKQRVLLATRSTHKAAEIDRILRPLQIELVTLVAIGVTESAEEDTLENRPTFLGNAVAKAQYFATLTKLPTLADDSGLEVVALDDRPGVRTRRFALDHGHTGLEGEALDRANNQLLQQLLRDQANRAARYVCCAALVRDRNVVAAMGTARGEITTAPRGRGGFGYDPLFLIPALGRTFAELPAEEKERRSHRGRAFRALAALL